MSTAHWPAAEPGLERAYRCLLRAYPRAYRRRHGPEIVTTLLEMAEPGQRRPSRAEAWHLLGSGLRQRFRLPAGRPLARVIAVLALLVGGGLGSAVGSWAAEQTFAELPGRAAIAAVHATAVGAPGEETSYASREGSPWWGGWAGSTTQVTGFDGWDVEQARQRLTADGWQLGPVTRPDGGSATTDTQGNTVELETRSAAFRAERDGVVMDVNGGLTEQRGMVSTDLWSAGNATLLPFTVVGGLLGLAVGWLLAAAALQRMRRLPVRRARIAGGLTVLGIGVSALPAVAFYGNVIRAFEHAGSSDMVFTVHSALNPGPYWPFGPGWLNAALSGAGLLLGLGVLGATWGPRPGPAAARTAIN